MNSSIALAYALKHLENHEGSVPSSGKSFVCGGRYVDGGGDYLVEDANHANHIVGRCKPHKHEISSGRCNPPKRKMQITRAEGSKLKVCMKIISFENELVLFLNFRMI